MRILLLSQFYDPEPTLMGHTFAKGLAARGHEVRVLTGFPNYPSGALAQGYRLRPHVQEVRDGVVIDRVFLYPSHDRSVLKRAANYGSFAISSGILASLSRWRPDVVWVYNPPPTAALGALAMRTLHKTPFVLEIQDLWPDSLSETGMVGEGRVTRGVAGGLAAIYRRAAGIICIADGMAEALHSRGVPQSKINVIWNWADEDRLQFDEQDRQWALEVLDPRRFNLVFTGNVGPAQALESVVQAVLLAAKESPEIKLTVVGGGLSASELAVGLTAADLGHVEFVDRQPMSRVAALLDMADAGVVHLRRTPLFDITIPSKTQAYLASGLPVLMAVKGDGATLVAQSGGGVLAEPQDPTDIARAIGELFRASGEERAAVGRRGREFYINEMSVQVGLDKYEELFSRVAHTSTP